MTGNVTGVTGDRLEGRVNRRKVAGAFPTVLALALATGALGACGGSADSGREVLARVGSREVTRATLNHWTATFVRGDYYAVTRKPAPPGLASDPPNYRACASAARTIRSPTVTRSRLSPAQLQSKCRELYATVTREALGYLITVLWSEGQAAERGYRITSADVAERIAQTQREDYPQPGAFASYLAKKGWSRPDLAVIVKRNLLAGEVLRALERTAGKGPAAQPVLARLLEENARRWTARTSCTTLIVEQCKQYRGAPATTQSAAVIFEQMLGTAS